MGPVALLITFILIALLIIAIMKKINMAVTLFILTLLAYVFATILNGVSVMGEASVGAAWADVFEIFPNSFKGTITGTGLIILFVVAYSTYLGEIGASQRLGHALAVPLLKLKSPVLLLALSTLISFLLMCVLPSAMGAFVVCLGVIFPTLVEDVKLNPVSVLVAFFLGCCVVAGPANPFVMLTMQLIGTDLSVAEFFVQYALPVTLISIILTGFVAALWNLHLDKTAEFPKVVKEALPPELDLTAPGFYAFLPILPIVLLIVFSRLTGIGIVFSVAGAYTCSFIVVMIIHFLLSKDKVAAYNGFAGFFDAMSSAMKMPIVIVIMSMFFGQGLAALGGLRFMLEFLTGSLNLGFWPFMIIIAIVCYFASFVGAGTASFAICAPMSASVIASMGAPELVPVAILVITFIGQQGMMICPFDPKWMYSSQICDNYNVMEFVKRALVPSIFTLVCGFVINALFFGGIF